MKKKIIYLSLCCILSLTCFIACEESPTTMSDDISGKSFSTKSSKIYPVGVYNEDDENFELSRDEEQLLENWNENLSRLQGIDAQLKQLAFVKTDSVFVLRAKGNEWTSTLLLVETSSIGASKTLAASKISCTSKDCANTNGCLPNFWGTKCTKCNYGFGDCKKTVTSGATGSLGSVVDEFAQMDPTGF